MDVLTIALLAGLFGRVVYGLHKDQGKESIKPQEDIAKVLTKGNVVSINDPLVDRLKSNLELFLASEDALSRSDTESYLRLKSEAINNAKKVVGNKRGLELSKQCCQK